MISVHVRRLMSLVITGLVSVVAITATACAREPMVPGSPAAPSTSLDGVSLRPGVGDTIRIPVGAVAASADGSLLVTFDRVDSDSRCPIDVVCVWAGDAELVIGISPPDGRWSWSTLHTHLEPRTLHTASHTITLHHLEPANQATMPTDPGEYVAVMTVGRR